MNNSRAPPLSCQRLKQQPRQPSEVNLFPASLLRDERLRVLDACVVALEVFIMRAGVTKAQLLVYQTYSASLAHSLCLT